jgi:hypothetical protein
VKKFKKIGQDGLQQHDTEKAQEWWFEKIKPPDKILIRLVDLGCQWGGDPHIELSGDLQGLYIADPM